MSKKLSKALANQKKSVEPYNQKLDGILGITIGGNRKVEVPNRNSYVYVRLRNSQSELIQAFNNKVAPVYNLPVLVERQGNRYVVIDVDTQRYDNNWSSYSPYLPRHGNTHSFDPESGGGGDTVWVHSRQFMPLLAFPSGSVGSPNLIVAPYILKKENGTWMYVGNTGTAGFTPYNPPNSGTAVMGLIALNTDTGNPYLIIGSGSSFSDTITGTSQIYSYIPPLTNPAHIPIAAVRLVSGTNRLTWDNIYDVRQFLHPINTGSAGGLSSIAVQDEAVPQGNATTFDFAGANVSVSISGSVARVYVTGSSSPGGFTGDANAVVLTDGSGNLVTEDWLRYGVAARPYIDLGADVVNKETNAGRIGYNVFSDTMEFFHIVGAGTGVSARRVKIFDELYVDRTAYAREFNINDPSGQYMITGSPHQHTSDIYTILQQLPRGTLINGMIHPTISSGTLNLALKTWAGQDPSASDSARIRIGDQVRTISSPLSITIPTGTSYFNLGSAELATKETDLFAYLLWDSNTSSVKISASRIPYGTVISDFSSTITNEKHLFNHSSYLGTDNVELIGRFAATLSATPFVWSVPTYTNKNLIRKPIYESRLLDYNTVITPQAGSLSSIVRTAEKYQVIGSNFIFDIYVTFTTNTSAPAYIQFSVPFTFGQSTNFSGVMTDGVAPLSSNVTSSSNLLFVRKYDASGFTVGSSRDVRMRFNASLV